MKINKRGFKLMERYHVFMDWRLNIIKMSILPNLLYRFSVILIKVLASHLIEIDKLILKLHGKVKELEWPNGSEEQDHS